MDRRFFMQPWETWGGIGEKSKANIDLNINISWLDDLLRLRPIPKYGSVSDKGKMATNDPNMSKSQFDSR